MSCDHVLKGTDSTTGTVFGGRTVFNLQNHLMLRIQKYKLNITVRLLKYSH